MTLRCPACQSSVLVDREPDRLALVCLGCGRHWEPPTPRERAFRATFPRLRALLRAEPPAPEEAAGTWARVSASRLR